MRIKLTIFIIGIFGLFLFFNLPASIISNKATLPATGKVLGVNEIASGLSIHDLDKKIFKFPQADVICEEKKPKAPIPRKRDSVDISLSECSGIVLDPISDTVLFSRQSDVKLPIASISKLAAMLTFLDLGIDWNNYYQIKANDWTEGGRIYVQIGEYIKIKDLFYLSLIASANTADRALVSATGMAEDEFVAAMNEKMKNLKLENTHFLDPIGLSRFNVSTAFEVAKLAQFAFENEFIKEAVSKKTYEFTTKNGRKIIINNTNNLLNKYPRNGIKILGGKTGFTSLAGYCFVGKFIDDFGHELISVVLGGDTYSSRFQETSKMIDWAYDNFFWE